MTSMCLQEVEKTVDTRGLLRSVVRRNTNQTRAARCKGACSEISYKQCAIRRVSGGRLGNMGGESENVSAHVDPPEIGNLTTSPCSSNISHYKYNGDPQDLIFDGKVMTAENIIQYIARSHFGLEQPDWSNATSVELARSLVIQRVGHMEEQFFGDGNTSTDAVGQTNGIDDESFINGMMQSLTFNPRAGNSSMAAKRKEKREILNSIRSECIRLLRFHHANSTKNPGPMGNATEFERGLAYGDKEFVRSAPSVNSTDIIAKYVPLSSLLACRPPPFITDVETYLTKRIRKSKAQNDRDASEKLHLQKACKSAIEEAEAQHRIFSGLNEELSSKKRDITSRLQDLSEGIQILDLFDQLRRVNVTKLKIAGRICDMTMIPFELDLDKIDFVIYLGPRTMMRKSEAGIRQRLRLFYEQESLLIDKTQEDLDLVLQNFYIAELNLARLRQFSQMLESSDN
eukprot:CAMPEP_0114502522 /NCGR_PEP_ID=MMETSP0109-20121206/9144_1 /TAXON_ID=29199 /ORGANISM="Chlorarachnion reptans, Strain CCCM449" /LENGTH=456 /DNA_ID=CAMNT_0001680459 /DNA_START=81 /DNA_END=1452 /DNA_ORIENTATION=+